MRLITPKLLLLLICLATALRTRAQVCEGSLGDPVINQTFGAGTNPGAPLPFGVTNMLYTSSNTPNDGYYTIATSLAGAANTHPYTWQQVTQDHTGNPNGYMMIINAGLQPSIFFTDQANGLCPNTTYFFSAYILNLMIPGFLTATYTHPNITFSIETLDGKQLVPPYNTGDLPAFQEATWKQYGVTFQTPPGVTTVVVKMSNNAPGGNGNDFILDDITFRACGPIIQAGFGATDGPASNALCEGSSATYTLKANVIAAKPVLQWQSNINNGGWNDISGETTESLKRDFVSAVAGLYQYRLGVGNGSGIEDVACRVYSDPLTVKVNPLPVVPAIPPQIICQGDQLTLSAAGGATYTWTGPNMAPTKTNPLVISNVTAANTGTYSVLAVSDAGCAAAPVQTQVTVIPRVVPGISNSTAICAGETTRLMATGGTTYKWTPSTGLDHDDIANPIASPLQTTIYTVDISNGACDDNSKTVTVTVNQNPIAGAGNNFVLFEGQSAKLAGTVKGDNITGYAWSPATFLDDPTLLTPVAAPTEDITYTLTATSATCGTSTSSVFIRVYKKVIIPNAFSPNNDGINDLWDIQALITYPLSSTQVFDRYGRQVFQTTGYSKPWDGTYNGSPLPAGVYYYIIDLKNNTPKLAGWILIVR